MAEHERERDRRIEKLAALADPVRRALYDAVVQRAPEPVSRDQAASATGVRRALAAFHLDKLVASGLLEPMYRRLTGRSGPGAGRPAKLYRRSTQDVGISLPERRYDLLAGFALQALANEPEGRSAERARQLAREFGRNLGEQAGASTGSSRRPRQLLDTISKVLAAGGYEPRAGSNGALRLHNCPFASLAAQYRSTVCRINLALQEGLVEGLGASGRLRAELQPAPGWCCVALFDVKAS